MKKELQDKLYQKYPKIFQQKDLPMTQTCMCWGIDTGDGWFRLLDYLCAYIQNYISYNPHSKIPQVEATQVKEKFGGLRFYYIGGDDRIDGIMDFAQSLSYHICEDCGSTGEDVSQTKGCIMTLCKKCRKDN